MLGFELEITSVELVIYPLGCGLLEFHIDWIPERLNRVGLSLDELRTYDLCLHI